MKYKCKEEERANKQQNILEKKAKKDSIIDEHLIQKMVREMVVWASSFMPITRFHLLFLRM